MFRQISRSRAEGCLFSVLMWALATRAATSAPALQLFSDPRQVISPVAMAEDVDGALWIAADQGVFEFDGRHFLRIPGEFEGPAAIAVLGQRTVLIACRNGIFQFANGRITRLTGEAANGLIQLGDDIVLSRHSRIGNDMMPIYWMSAVISDDSTTRLRRVDGIDGWAWLSSDDWLSFACGVNPCSVRNSIAFRESLKNDRLKDYVHDNAIAGTHLALPPLSDSILRDLSGTYVFRPMFSGVFSVRPPTGGGHDYNVGEFTRAGGRPGIYSGRSGRLWIPGDYLYVRDGGALERFVAPQLDAIRVNCVFEDRHGHTWFGLAENGLAVMGSGPVAESWITPVSLGEVNSLVRQSPSILYATTSKGALLMRKPLGEKNATLQATDAWNVVDAGEDGPKVVQLAASTDGTMIGLTSVGPPVRLDAAGRVLERIAPDPAMMLSSLRRLVRAPDGAYLIGSQQFPQCLYRIRGSVVERIAVDGRDGNVHDIGIDSSGRAWVGYANGVCRIENAACRSAISQADGLLQPAILSLAAGPPDEIWVAYRSGFSCFRLVNGRWAARHFSESDGYQVPRTHFLRRDRRGWIWRGTSQGLFVSDGVHVEPGDWLLISDRDGLPSANINLYGFLEDTDGSIWVGTARGIAHLRPDPTWFRAPGGQITAIAYESKRHLASTALPSVFEGPGEFKATIGTFGLLPVRYRLWPAEQGWHVAYDAETKAQRLEPGRYEFQSAAGPDGSISRYRFQVVPTFASRLRTAMLAGSPVVALGVLGVFLWRRRTRNASLPPLPDLAEARLAILSPDAGSLISTTLAGRFVPQNLLARGGFGTVFEGRDIRTGERCAIKIFRQEFGDEQRATQFRQEIAALEAIQHPNIVKLLGSGATTDGAPFLAMEFIEGSTLRHMLKKGPVPPGTCAGFLTQIGSALQSIHARNIFHRDVKPENLMIRSSAHEGADIVLIDFSMAIIRDPDRSLFGLSRAGGTVHYMAPEQALGHASAEGDIYSLGKVVIEMLTGSRIADLLPEATLDLAGQTRVFLEAHSLGLSPVSITVLASSLEFDPSRRVHAVREFVEPIARDLALCAAERLEKAPPVASALPLPTNAGLDGGSASSGPRTPQA